MILQLNKTDVELFNLIEYLADQYPLHITQPKRIKEIINQISCSKLTVEVEDHYIDKQYRECYYSYYSQKYSQYERDCIRLTLFDTWINVEGLLEKTDKYLENHLVGTIVLRPLHVGNIGLTLINPKKLKTKGYFRTAKYTFMTFGRKLCVSAFPFSSQDGDVMTCAENALYNLINYYGTRYSDYRVLSPGDISKYLETVASERVLPSRGVRLLDLAKVLDKAHLYPTLYRCDEYFRDIFFSYCESGIPFLLTIPSHVVTCVGHSDFQFEVPYIPKAVFIENQALYLVSSAQFIESYIFMDDNNYPYLESPLNDLVLEYSNRGTISKSENQKNVSCKEGTFDNFLGSGITEDDIQDIAMIVPLHRRTYLDAAKAREIFLGQFLLNEQFVAFVKKEYGDDTWGAQCNNPMVYRFFLTTSRNYKEFKRQHESSSSIKKDILSNPFPHFIWVMEISTLSLIKERKARVEIILDASSSYNSQENAILNIRFFNHNLFTPDIIDLMNEPVKQTYSKSHSFWEETERSFQNQALTTMFDVLYTNPHKEVSSAFDMFDGFNLERM